MRAYSIILNDGWFMTTRYSEKDAEKMASILKENFPNGKVEIKEIN